MLDNNLKAIQFVGTQRSGSNLLRVMLNQLHEISAPHPPHILKTFFPLLDRYGDLSVQDNFLSLAHDVCEWVNVNPVPWDDITFNAYEITSACEQNTLMELFIRIYEKKALHDKANFWCCKSMESVYYLEEIEHSGLKPFYIHIYRDGRDVALSFLKAIVGPKHVYQLAKKWSEEQELSLKVKERVGEKRFISIRYEEFIHKPERVMKSICQALGVPYSSEVFEYFHSEESINTANSGRMWQNVIKPIMPNNHNKFERELTQEQLIIFERIAGEMLNTLGYETLFWPNVIPTPFTGIELENFHKENDIQMKKVMDRADEEELRRRKPQEELLSKIKSKKRILI